MDCLKGTAYEKVCSRLRYLNILLENQRRIIVKRDRHGWFGLVRWLGQAAVRGIS
jgi:hypothetical protein